MRQFQSSFVISKTTLKNIETALREKRKELFPSFQPS